MKRPGTCRAHAGAHQEVARDLPRDLTIRSTFIVGFPGETEEEFQNAARLG
jgi:tRNA A37 methylthiotransferase MiaB